jgi:hypothetical protein
MKKNDNSTPEIPESDSEKIEEIRKQNEAFAAEAFEMFRDSYPPANNIDEATRFLTTDEIAATIRNIFPTTTIDLYLLCLFLKNSQYQYAPMLNEFNPCFKWMIK